MKVLHVTAINTLSARSGIPAVVKGLCDYQNKFDDVESRVLSLKAKVDNVGSPFFDYIGNCRYMDYLKVFHPDLVIIHDFYHYQLFLNVFQFS